MLMDEATVLDFIIEIVRHIDHGPGFKLQVAIVGTQGTHSAAGRHNIGSAASQALSANTITSPAPEFRSRTLAADRLFAVTLPLRIWQYSVIFCPLRNDVQGRLHGDDEC